MSLKWGLPNLCFAGWIKEVIFTFVSTSEVLVRCILNFLHGLVLEFFIRCGLSLAFWIVHVIDNFFTVYTNHCLPPVAQCLKHDIITQHQHPRQKLEIITPASASLPTPPTPSSYSKAVHPNYSFTATKSS